MSKIVPFYKMEAVGNDFVLVESWHVPQELTDWSQLAQRLCNRPLGIGSDGLLVLASSDRADLRMRMFNPDGTEDFCGNGLRCAARFAFENGWTNKTAFSIETLGGEVVPVEVQTGLEGEVQQVTIALGKPRFHPSEVPALVEGEEMSDYPLTIGDHTWTITSLRVGSTHTVILVDRLPNDELFGEVSPRIENHLLFPERTSVLWCVVESRQALRLRIWERGVGETLGCGTGAGAATVAARCHGWVEGEVQVISKGGTLQVHWNPDEPVRLTGPTHLHFEGQYYFE